MVPDDSRYVTAFTETRFMYQHAREIYRRHHPLQLLKANMLLWLKSVLSRQVGCVGKENGSLSAFIIIPMNLSSICHNNYEGTLPIMVYVGWMRCHGALDWSATDLGLLELNGFFCLIGGSGDGVGMSGRRGKQSLLWDIYLGCASGASVVGAIEGVPESFLSFISAHWVETVVER